MIRIFNLADRKHHDWHLEKGTYIIGRDLECDLVIEDDTVSRKHAKIEIVNEKKIKLTDLGSHNGTTVNGKRIESPVSLKQGDIFALGRIELEFTTADISKTKGSSLEITNIDEDLTRATLISMDEALKPLPSKILEDPNVFKAISEVGKMLILPGDDEQMLEKGIELLQKVIPAGRIAVFLTDESGEDVCLSACCIAGEKHSKSFCISRTIIKEILSQKKAILISDPQAEEKYAEQQSIIKSSIKSAMAVPLYDEGRVFGILYADTTNPAHHYTEDYLRITATFANILAAKMTNNNLLSERRAREILESELAIASQIQKQLLPKELPTIDGYRLNAFQIQCKHVGGDLYDAIELDDGRILLILADVSGKGVGAALQASNILASFRTLYNVGEISLLDAVCKVSKQLQTFSRPGDFATLFIGLLNPESNSMRFINAGHNPPLLIRSDGKTEYLEASGIPIGMMDYDEWKEDSIDFYDGDIVFIFSDGIPEAINSVDEQFGDERLEKLAMKCSEQSPKVFTDTIMTEVDNFIGENPRSDDITMIVLSRKR
ncbi:MAG: SpoIIE family protein phosphatase [candidate division Zixibacteria bacterium]